ncbi:TetR/AcrR family transcriptional regulator C-terminal domain-containing protein [Amycolatopsis sp. NPDC023774]|uniref:TetR/AcrR family transcriptional regulator C-terminal domain-containing protein n=1 Tax=Amycolatopsis sp. NPDC023774 TaxID=3155015 RepID=UPI0033D26A16
MTCSTGSPRASSSPCRCRCRRGAGKPASAGSPKASARRSRGTRPWCALVAEEANPRSPGALRVIDVLLGALLDAGLDEEAAARGYRSLMGLRFGAALADSVAGDVAQRDEPVGDWFSRMVTPEELPNLYRVLPSLADVDCVQDFHDQLDLLLTGLRAAAAR